MLQPRASRVALRVAATVTLQDAHTRPAHTHDLTAGGIRLQLADALPLAQLCAIRFAVQCAGQLQQVLAMGQVVYCDTRDDGHYSAGIKFIELDRASAATVAALLLHAA